MNHFMNADSESNGQTVKQQVREYIAGTNTNPEDCGSQEFIDEYTKQSSEATMAERIKLAVEDAQLAFWASITKAFPECKTGDFPIDLTFEMEENLTTYVSVWVKANE